MQSGVLSALIIALTGSFWGATQAHAAGAAYQINIYTAALYSVAAQASTTGTVASSLTPTIPVTATSVITGSGAITATATTTNSSPTVPPSTPIPLATAVPQANLQINPFDWTYLTSVPPDPKIGPFAIAFIVLMFALIAGGLYLLRFKQPQWKGTNPVLYKANNRFTPYAIWIGLIGILFMLFRAISLDFFNLRFWPYLIFLLLLGLLGWIYYWYRTSYPKEMAKFLKTQKARQYMPGKNAGRSPAMVSPPRGSQPARSAGTGKPGVPTTPNQRPAQQGSKNRKKR